VHEGIFGKHTKQMNYKTKGIIKMEKVEIGRAERPITAKSSFSSLILYAPT
jgi:hypothetical protein